MKSFVEQLAAYLQNTSAEQLRKDWEELKSYNDIGDYVPCYIDNVHSYIELGKMVETVHFTHKNPDYVLDSFFI